MNAPEVLRWSYGRSRYDVRPAQHAGTLRDLAAFAKRHRAASKEAAGYVCAPLLPNATRSRAGTAPRAWLAIDADGIAEAAHVDWRLFLTRFRGLGWPTASSTPERPRERVIVALDEAVSYDDGVRLGALLAGDIETNFGAAVLIDASTFRGSQPCFLPLTGAPMFYLLGEPLNVERWLDQAPPPRPAPPPLDEAGAAVADAGVRWLLGKLGEAGMLRQPLANGIGYALRCPWEHAHTMTGGTASTALLYPAEANGWRGAFSCLHSHCRHRTLNDLHGLVRRALAKKGQPC